MLEVLHRFVELPDRVNLTLPDGTLRVQWSNGRLWNMYRGTSVAPHVLECALMALERWLLDLCRTSPKEVEGWLVRLLTQSNNVAITAVAASVAIAHPQSVGSAGCALLTCPEFFGLDRARWVHDYSPVGRAFEGMPVYNVEWPAYQAERKEADALAHRRLHLEHLALQLQTGPLRDQVWQILEGHREHLPPLDQQSDGDKLWRLALHRMDIRTFEAKGTTPDGKTLFGPREPEPDLQQIIEERAPTLKAREERSALLTWGIGVFRQEDRPYANPNEWRARLAEAQTAYQQLAIEPKDLIEWRMNAAGPAYVAAISIRDRWDELDTRERAWCARVVVESIKRDADCEERLLTSSRTWMDPSRPAAFAVSALFNRGLSPHQERDLLPALGLALSHAADEVVDYAVEGVGAFLWKADRELALMCVAALVRGAEALRAAEEREKAKPFQDRVWGDSTLREARVAVRAAILTREVFREDRLLALDFEDWPGRRALRQLLPLFARHPEEAPARKFFAKMSQSLANWWRKDSAGGARAAELRDFELERVCVDQMSRFILQLPLEEAVRLCTPLLEVTAGWAEEVGNFLESLILSEDTLGSGTIFWSIWQQFADRVLAAPWAALLDERHGGQVRLINELFLGVNWKEGVRQWQRLGPNDVRLSELFQRMPLTGPLIVAYCRFLYTVGGSLLPNAFVLVAEKLRQDEVGRFLKEAGDAVFYLEGLLQRWVYSQPAKLKGRVELRDAVLYLLDHMVEAGSSVAYRMRDDFVTPMQPPPDP